MIKKFNQISHIRTESIIVELSQKKHNNLNIKISINDQFKNKISENAKFVYRFLDYEASFGVWLINIPYCAVDISAYDHIHFDENYRGDKNSSCKNCKFNKLCGGFPSGYIDKFSDGELQAIPDQPVEVMLEIEPNCNFSCSFCYNHNSFAGQGRDIKKIPTGQWKEVINNISNIGIKTVRFTGGEPMLRNDIFDLMRYAKEMGLEVRLNTNCSLITADEGQKFNDILDNVLIPIESHLPEMEDRITGFNDSLAKKVEAIKIFSGIDVPVVRVGTVISTHFLDNIDEFTDFVLKLPIQEWEFYRPVSRNADDQLDIYSIEKVVDHILAIRKRTVIKLSIANAIPFCALSNLNLLNSVSNGATFEDGHSRMVVDPRGHVKPHYFIEENIGNIDDLLGAWKSEYMRKMRGLECIPVECNGCRFRYKCRGGSRHEALMKFNKINAKDPLANFDNI